MKVALLAVFFPITVLLAGEPVKISDPKDQEIIKNFLVHVDKVPQEVSLEKCKKMAAENTEGFTWEICPFLDMPLTAYRITRDEKYLDLFVRVFANMRAAMTEGPDGFLGWYGKPLDTFQNPENPDFKSDVIINSFRAAEILLDFLHEIAQTPETAKRFASDRVQYLGLIENHLVKKWTARGNYTDLGKLGAVYRTEAGLKDVKTDLTQPHNKHAIIIRALTALYRETGKDEYMRMAVKLGFRFKHCLTLKNGHYEWNYWDPAGEWDINPKEPGQWKMWIGVEHKGGYYSATLEQAVELYRYGLVFGKTDIDRFLKTQLEVCWNGDAAKPQWARCDGTKSDKYMQGDYICPALAPFDQKIADFLFVGARQDERIKNASHGWQGGPVANQWLKEKYLELPAAEGGPQTCLEYGKRFLSKPENAAFVKALEFEISEPGYAAPQTPKDMKVIPKTPAKNAGGR